MDLQLPENLPIWILLTIIFIRMFGPQIGRFLFEKFPNMADKHFSSAASDRIDQREFDQKRQLEILRVDLKAKESNQKHIEELYNQQVQRERIYTDIIMKQFDFLHELANSQLVQVEASVVSEIKALRSSFEILAFQLRSEVEESDDLLTRRLDLF